MAKRLTKVSKQKENSISWQEALQAFLFWKKAQGISTTTNNDYKRHVNYFFNRYSESWQNPILKHSIMEYMSDNIKPATFNLRLIYLRSFFEWSINEKYLEFNPLEGFKTRRAQSRIVDISEEALQRLLTLPDQSTYAGLRDYALLIFTLDTGLRPKEALSLLKEDFDLRYSVVTIPAEQAKTRVSRTLPILPPTAQAINSLLKARHPAWQKDIPVFCSSEGTHLARSSWRRRLDIYSDKLGVKIRPYDLRHVFALLYLRSGGNAFSLQKTLGHTDMAMTKRYINLSGDDLQEIHLTASPLNRLIKKKNRIKKVKVILKYKD